MDLKKSYANFTLRIGAIGSKRECKMGTKVEDIELTFKNNHFKIKMSCLLKLRKGMKLIE